MDPELALRDILRRRSNSVAFAAKRTLSRSQSRIFEYTSYRIRMMKLQMRVGGMCELLMRRIVNSAELVYGGEPKADDRQDEADRQVT